MSPGYQAIGIEKCRIAGDGLVQQIDRWQQNCLAVVYALLHKKVFGSRVEIECGDIGCWLTFDGVLFNRRKCYLQLLRNCLRNVAVNGKHVGEIAVVSLPPKTPVCT